MKRERELAQAAVESYGQPEFPTVMIEFTSAVGDENAQLHLLRDAGLQKAMVSHARDLKRQGQKDAARGVLREVGIRFGNSTRR